MNRQRLNQFDVLSRVVSFFQRTIALFPKKLAVAELLKAAEADLDTLKEITNSAVSSSTAVRAAMKIKVAARVALTDLLARASHVCREFDSPQLELPRHRMRDQVLLALSRSFVANAEPVKSVFAQHGLEIEEIETAVQNMEAAVLEFSNAKMAKDSADQKWEAALADALAKLRRFDLLVENVLRDNPIALSEYETARAIPKPAGRKSEKKEVAAAATPAA